MTERSVHVDDLTPIAQWVPREGMTRFKTLAHVARTSTGPLGPSLAELLAHELDFTPVLRTAITDCGVASPFAAIDGLEAFLQWVSLTPLRTHVEHFVMLKGDADRIWHAAIINTALDRKMCDDYLGGFLDHEPSPAKPPQQWILETVGLLKAYFGPALHPIFAGWERSHADAPSRQSSALK